MTSAFNLLSRSTDAISGVGLFSGAPATLAVHPGAGSVRFTRTQSGRAIAGADANAGRVTTDTSWTGLPGGVPVRNTTLDATIGPEPERHPSAPAFVVATVEHLLGALAGLGIWNAGVQLEGGPEVPILDGSALPFVEALRPVLETTQRGPTPLVLEDRIELVRGEAFIRAEPSSPADPIEYTYSLDFGQNAPIPAQRATWRGSPAEFAQAVAPARTFSLLAEARIAQQAGLFGHLTPRDMLVIDDRGRPIDNEWRMENEPSRHKLLDLIGDLALLARPLHARVVAHRAGHALTHEFCRRVLAIEGHRKP